MGTEGPDNLNANISGERRDKWVYEFSKDIMPPFATHAQSHA